MSVNGVPRMVCGVTEDTTCQEVVLALAQALGMYICSSVCGKNHLQTMSELVTKTLQVSLDATPSGRNLKTSSGA